MSRYELEIVENVRIAEGFYKLTLDAKEISRLAQPGQFVHIKIPQDASLLLRRPLSINAVDLKNHQIDLVYQVAGKGTEILSRLNRGSSLDILGPLGRGFWIPPDTDVIYIVGGGCGVAPLKFVGQRWQHHKITSFLGFRNRSTAFQIKDFEGFSAQVFLSTEDGSLGKSGFIIETLKERLLSERPDLILACGPIPMLEALQDLAAEHDIPCQISLEERMGCGIGGCMVCTCAIGNNLNHSYKKVCADGPVFWSKEVVLDGKTETKY